MTNLCVDCGICCSGYISRHVALKSTDEAERFVSQGGETGCKADKLYIHLPCSLHQGKCMAYESRPGVCREYECKLLIEVRAGAVMYESAIDIVNRMRSCGENILKQLSELSPSSRSKPPHIEPLYLQYKKALAKDSNRLHGREYHQLSLDITVFKYLRKKYFDPAC